MLQFEKRDINSKHLNPTRWKRYVDDTNVKWPHGNDEMNKFFEHLDNLLEDIKFTMDLEENRSIPFIDVMTTKKHDETIGHKGFRKKTHTKSYFHMDSHHHPSQNIGVLTP